MDYNNKIKIVEAVRKLVPLKEVAEKIFVTEAQLRLLLKKWNVEVPRKRAKYQKVPAPERQVLLTLYKKYRTTSKLAEHFGVGTNTVNRWMKSLKVPARKMKMSEGEKVRFLEEHLQNLSGVNL